MPFPHLRRRDTSQEAKDSFLAAGAAAVLAKPVNLGQLEAMRSLLSATRGEEPPQVAGGYFHGSTEMPRAAGVAVTPPPASAAAGSGGHQQPQEHAEQQTTSVDTAWVAVDLG